jgi:hypothetical protein
LVRRKNTVVRKSQDLIAIYTIEENAAEMSLKLLMEIVTGLTSQPVQLLTNSINSWLMNKIGLITSLAHGENPLLMELLMLKDLRREDCLRMM